MKLSTICIATALFGLGLQVGIRLPQNKNNLNDSKTARDSKVVQGNHIMNHDITYCTSKTCLHRRGCSRSLTNDENGADAIRKMIYQSFMDGSDCQANDYSDLIRFRLSDGSPIVVLKASN